LATISLRFGFFGDSLGVRSAQESHRFISMALDLEDKWRSGDKELIREATDSLSLLSGASEVEDDVRLQSDDDKSLNLPELSRFAAIF
jgi:hypothetical protein